MFDNKFTRRDPLAESVRQVMIENDIRRQVELTLNEQLGIQSRKQLPHEYLKEYDETLRAAINQTLNEGEGRGYPLGKSESGNQHARATPELTRQREAELKRSAKDKGDNVTSNIKETDKSISNPPEETTSGFTKEESEGSDPRNNREKDLAAKKPPYNKITHADVLKGRGVIAQEELNVALGKNQITRKDPAAPQALEEKAVSKAQHRFFGLVRGIQKGKAHGSAKAEKAAKSMSSKEVRKFAKTKEKGLPERVDESTKAILEEIQNNLQEQFVYIYENYDDSVMEQFLASLTMEEAYLLGLNEDQPGDGNQGEAEAKAKVNPAPAARPAGLGDAPQQSTEGPGIIDRIKNTAADVGSAIGSAASNAGDAISSALTPARPAARPAGPGDAPQQSTEGPGIIDRIKNTATNTFDTIKKQFQAGPRPSLGNNLAGGGNEWEGVRQMPGTYRPESPKPSTFLPPSTAKGPVLGRNIKDPTGSGEYGRIHRISNKIGVGDDPSSFRKTPERTAALTGTRQQQPAAVSRPNNTGGTQQYTPLEGPRGSSGTSRVGPQGPSSAASRPAGPAVTPSAASRPAGPAVTPSAASRPAGPAPAPAASRPRIQAPGSRGSSGGSFSGHPEWARRAFNPAGGG